MKLTDEQKRIAAEHRRRSIAATRAYYQNPLPSHEFDWDDAIARLRNMLDTLETKRGRP